MTVLYSSEYGYGDRLSQTLARGITKAGVATEMIDALSVDAQARRCHLYSVKLSSAHCHHDSYWLLEPCAQCTMACLQLI